MSKENHTGRKIAIGAMLAGVVGYLTGLLTAPKSGKETRADIASKAGDVKEATLAEAKKAQGEIGELLDRAKSEVLALSGKAKEEFHEALARAKDAQAKLAAVMKAVKSGKAKDPDLDKAIRQATQARKNLAKYLKA
ncbi:hypothetical protein A3A68_01705 [Candidatus Saccharibacteria bacterium RIFCSPLOWO2_01_FULL_48_13]|nr:MAG: hypothetical protein A2884_01845 [Candidatus Saccharibacteria bacterium RIFCSPHIGHO2_01_FULL_48_12]OGL35923.1 MAG: hypothetical protein A3F38_00275 [Candidatus Saccharibacteria bacterium RIFCSPHIGHO2_12_FULL_48_21]OGL37462.1 MAG: hypothetical protein A3A68_01705 [Candidatus Saccharibacteria bacterium RIFCSPLOWO2_01_FULL_48_13]